MKENMCENKIDWINELHKIYEILDKNNYENLHQELYDAQLIGATGGEILLIMTKKLNEIKNTEINIYNLIKTEVDRIIDFGLKWQNT